MNILFITYINRSGSTYLANIFSKYNEVLVCPEADVLISKFLINPSRPYKFDDHEKTEIKKIIEFDNKLKNWNLSFQDLSELENAKFNFEAFCKIIFAYRKKIKPVANSIVFKGDILIHYFTYFAHPINFLMALVQILRLNNQGESLVSCVGSFPSLASSVPEVISLLPGTLN